jgi:phenylacetate-CoA ligase
MNVMEFDRDRNLEFSRPEEIRKVQEGLLHKHVLYLASHSPYYQALFTVQGIDVAKITVDTLHTIPLTDKTALSLANDDFLAVPLSQIVDIVLSSGTTGKPTKMLYTETDLKRLASTRNFPSRAAD